MRYPLMRRAWRHHHSATHTPDATRHHLPLRRATPRQKALTAVLACLPAGDARSSGRALEEEEREGDASHPPPL